MSGPSQDPAAVRQIVDPLQRRQPDLDGPDNIFQDTDYGRVLGSDEQRLLANPDRNYTLGYNFGCAPDGDLWEIRGFDIRCAANGCQPVNKPAIAIQITTTVHRGRGDVRATGRGQEPVDPVVADAVPERALVIDTHANVRTRAARSRPGHRVPVRRSSRSSSPGSSTTPIPTPPTDGASGPAR